MYMLMTLGLMTIMLRLMTKFREVVLVKGSERLGLANSTAQLAIWFNGC